MRTVFFVLAFFLLVVLAVPFSLFCLLTRMRDPVIDYGKWGIRIARWILGIRLEVSGLERIDPETPYIFMPNHVSFLDGPLLYMLIPRRVRAIIKKSAFGIPAVGQAMLLAGFVSVDRRGIRGGKRSIDRASSLMRERGYSFLVFPEGTRSRDGRLQVFRRGGFFLALESGVPIVPMTIKGTFELMPKGQMYARPGRVRVAFHDPVPVHGYTKETMGELIERVRRIIAEG